MRVGAAILTLLNPRFVTMTLYTLTITCVAAELQRRNITLKFW